MSRPSSRLSGVRASDQQHARNSTQATGTSSSSGREREYRSVSSSSSNATIQARPQSAMSYNSAHARVPFTPGANKISKIANLGLSAKQVDKLSESIANIQRGAYAETQDLRRTSVLQAEPASHPVARVPAGKPELLDRKGKSRGGCWLSSSQICIMTTVDIDWSYLTNLSFAGSFLHCRDFICRRSPQFPAS